MERRLVVGPALRAGLIAFLAVPGLVLLQGALLAHEGVTLALEPFVLAVVLPSVLSVLLTVIIFWLMIGRHAITFREVMRTIAARPHTLGAPETTEHVEPDLLGIRETFDVMRRELDRALRRLAHADEQRRRLFADLAHELSTPASALLALGDTLGQSDVDIDDLSRRRLTRSLEGETLRIARLVEDIRDLAELDDPDVSFVRERTDLAAVVAGTVERFAAADGAAIATDAQETFAEIDPMRVDQAMTNLLHNARRHTPLGGSIRVAVYEQGDSAVVVVEDDGPGVPPEALGRLGERLFRVDSGRDRRNGGHGLGLAIVRATMARHAGTTRFEAGETGGLRVTLTLPRAP